MEDTDSPLPLEDEDPILIPGEIYVPTDETPTILKRIAVILESLDAKTLTKREQLAGMAMQAIIRNGQNAVDAPDVDYEIDAIRALRYGDAILAELEKEKE